MTHSKYPQPGSCSGAGWEMFTQLPSHLFICFMLWLLRGKKNTKPILKLPIIEGRGAYGLVRFEQSGQGPFAA